MGLLSVRNASSPSFTSGSTIAYVRLSIGPPPDLPVLAKGGRRRCGGRRRVAESVAGLALALLFLKRKKRPGEDSVVRLLNKLVPNLHVSDAIT
jgi:hypothetical protein